jgi:hypothetical protein
MKVLTHQGKITECPDRHDESENACKRQEKKDESEGGDEHKEIGSKR